MNICPNVNEEEIAFWINISHQSLLTNKQENTVDI
jgi:hypothetical protein